MERLSAGDKKTLLIWILCALIGGGVASKYFFRAFPEASIDFRVSRRAAVGLARQFAKSQGADLARHRTSIVFNVDDTAKTYLERELGLQQANQLMSSQVHTWYWSVRFFQPLQKEEFHVNLDPAGEIVGYEHVVAEEAPGARLDQAAARAKAESFLRETLHKDSPPTIFSPRKRIPSSIRTAAIGVSRGSSVDSAPKMRPTACASRSKATRSVSTRNS